MLPGLLGLCCLVWGGGWTSWRVGAVFVVGGPTAMTNNINWWQNPNLSLNLSRDDHHTETQWPESEDIIIMF